MTMKALCRPLLLVSLACLGVVLGCGEDEVAPKGSLQLELSRNFAEAVSGILVDVEDLDFSADGVGSLLDGGLGRVQEIGATGTPGAWFRRPDGGTFGDSPRVARAPDGTVYALSRRLILKFTNGGTTMDVVTDLPSGDAGPSFLDLTVDDEGNIWTVERVTPGVRKYSPSGTLLASWAAFQPDTVLSISSTRIDLDDQGRVYLTKGALDGSERRIYAYSETGLRLGTGPILDPMSPGEVGLAVNGAGTVFIHDRSNHRILRYSTVGTLDAEWPYDSGEDYASSIAVGPGGDLFLFDTGNRAMVRVDANTGTVSTALPAIDLPFLRAPSAIAVDYTDRVYILDQGDVDVYGDDRRSVGTLPLGWDLLGISPGGLLVGYRDLDTQLQRADPGGNVVSDTDAPEIRCGTMFGPAVDSNDNAYFAGASCYRVLEYDEAGNLVDQRNYFIGSDFPLAPRWMAVDPFDDLLVLDTGRKQVHRFRPDGELVDSMPLTPPAFEFATPGGGLAVDGEGRFYVAYAVPNLIQVYDRNGEFLGSWEDPDYGEGLFWQPAGLAVTPSGNLLVVDARSHRARELRVVEVPG